MHPPYCSVLVERVNSWKSGDTVFPDPIVTEAHIAEKALADRVTVDGAAVIVNLMKEWRSGGELLIILRNVTAGVPSSLSSKNDVGIPYQSYQVTTFSKKSGILKRLRPIYVDVDTDTDGVHC